MKLEVKNISCGYGKKIIIRDLSFKIKSGETFTILGPNGVGKTTLFKAILGFIKLQKGKILLNGKDISKISRKEYAKYIGYVPQAHIPPFPYKVIDVVLMGRNPHINSFSQPKKEDYLIALECLSKMGIEDLKDRTYTEISGGERQLTLIARALAQDSQLLIMDEPTSNLDYGNQMKVLKYIDNIVKDNKAVLMTTHYPNHVFLYSTKVATLSNNKEFRVGTPDTIMTEENLKDIYNIDVKIVSSENKGKRGIVKYCLPVM